VLGLLLAIFASNLIGAGDIKLALAFTLWSYHFGWSGWWFLFSCFLVLIAIITRGLKGKIPFAPYMTAGFLIANLILPNFAP
jgi:prepilin signal peptidase PulO-like enzyme (type II secretory pathway)